MGYVKIWIWILIHGKYCGSGSGKMIRILWIRIRNTVKISMVWTTTGGRVEEELVYKVHMNIIPWFIVCSFSNVSQPPKGILSFEKSIKSMLFEELGTPQHCHNTAWLCIQAKELLITAIGVYSGMVTQWHFSYFFLPLQFYYVVRLSCCRFCVAKNLSRAQLCFIVRKNHFLCSETMT